MVPLLLALALSWGTPGAAGGSETEPEGVWPLSPEPAVEARFAAPQERWQPGHRGVDLAGEPGQAVLAALPGRVSFAGRVAGKPVVVVDHGGTRTTYEPVLALVSTGDRVVSGSRLGLLALPFSHCYPAACLHWGLRRGEVYLDPLTLVGADLRIRLLPLWPTGAGAGPAAGQALGWAWR